MLPFSNRLGRTAALLIAAGFIAHAAGGNITVTASDGKGKVLPGISVTISSPTQIGGSRTQITDSTGKVRFVRLTPGFFRAVLTGPGYQSQTINNIDVLVDQNSAVNAKLTLEGTATVEVLSSVQTVDVTQVTSGIQITGDELTSLPVGRNQLSALILAPGVVSVGGNPALAAGANRDNFGNNGARNNTYLLDGVDITNPSTGTLRTTIPVELIQTQDIKTGGITAEYSARAGLFSNVVTVPGGNEFHGGLSYQHDDTKWYNHTAKDRFIIPENRIDNTSVFVTGPIIKDKLWFVVNAEKVKDTSDVKLAASAAAVPGESRTAVNNDETRYFGKLTWQIAQGHQVLFQYMDNPTKFDNGGADTTPTRRLVQVTQGGRRWLAAYTWQTDKFILDVRVFEHNEDNSTKALYSSDGPEITKLFSLASGSHPVNDAIFGNSSADTQQKFKRNGLRVDGTYLFEAAGSHILKAGLSGGTDQQTTTVGVAQGAAFETYDQPLTYAQIRAGYSGNTRGAFAKVRAAINGQAQYANVLAALDTDQNGVVSAAELDAYRFGELLNPSRPELGYAGYRIIQDKVASSSPKMDYQGFYMQDQWQIGRLTVFPGLRADKYSYKADSGLKLFTTDLAFAPRVGITYDVEGDGRTKAYAYFGRYVDPLRLNLVGFTGSLSSSVRNEDIRIANTWVTENVRGGTKVVDAVFADNFKLPKTDEYRFGLEKDFGNTWSVSTVYTYRRDYDIVEDWDPTLYTDANALEDEGRALFALGNRTGPNAVPYANLTSQGKKVVDSFRALVINPNYFAGGGFTGQQNTDRVAGGQLNFVLANLPGGYRQYNTVDLTVTRKFKDGWGGYWTYSNVRATGNTNSSVDADFQGDLAQFDPRLPYTNGRLPGSIDWQHKVFAYKKWDDGFQIGVTFIANSGYHYSDSFVASRRLLQQQPTLANFGTEQLGNHRTPDTYVTDLRFSYAHKLGRLVKGEAFVDMLNAFNSQQAVDIAEVNGFRRAGTVAVGTPYNFLAPRRYRFGFRLTF